MLRKLIFNKHIRNKAFEISMDLQNLRELFRALVDDKIVTHDKYILVDTQIKLVEKEAETLKTRINQLYGDFNK